ncbi:MAG TPA: hypothetical protein DCZ71_03120, partial [Ruminococcus sp.]|nr:hypothetical protein [Ruminococcus sp.]
MKRFKAFAESVTGRSHTLTGKICQDSVGISENDRMSLAVVADGHGGKMYIRSDKGSAFAVEAAVSCIGRFVSSIAPDDDVCDGRMIPLSELMSPVHGEELIRNLEKSILVEWHRLVNQHHSAFPFSEEELEGLQPKEQRRLMGSDFCHAYGSTLIAAAVTEQFCLIIQIGDGYAVTVSGDGSASVALELDPLCHDNVCTSICQENAPEHFCHVLLTDIPAAVFAASDGVDDSYPGRSALLHFYNGLTSGFASGTDEGIDTVRRFLPRITDMGKGDDTSIVGIIDNSRIADAALKAGELFDIDAAREKDTMPDGSIMPPEGGGAETEQAPECAEKDLPEKTCVTSGEDAPDN